MRRGQGGLFILFILIILLWGGPSILFVQPLASSSESYVPGEVLLKLKRAGDLAAIAADYGLDPAPVEHFGSQPVYRMRIIDGVAAPDKAEALMDDPSGRVLYADPNFLHLAPEGRARVIYAGGGNAGEYAGQWASSLIRLPEAHTITRGAGITVAVLDTGVDFVHPALAGRLLPGYDFVDNDNDPSEEGVYGENAEFGHGTHVAGLIALAAPDAQIMPLRVLNPDGVGNIWALAEALAFAMNPDGNPATADGADVINLSLSTFERSDLIRDIIKAVTCNDNAACGAVVVMAAGNSSSSEREYPAGDGDNGTIAVGASTWNDSIAAFSNYSSWVSVAAPGEAILSSVPGGGYGTWSGTSMAAPLVAGEAALVRAAYPSLEPSKVVDRIIDKSVDIDKSIRYRIDAAAALGVRRARR